MKKFIDVTVPYYIPIALLGLINGAILTINTIPGFEIVYAAISLSFVVGGFNTLNGVYDKDIDKLNKPHRPIPKKAISIRAAKNYAFLLYLLAFLTSFLLNTYFILTVLFSIILTSFYSIPHIRLRSRFIINTLSGLVFYGILCPLAGWSLYPTFPMPILFIVFLFLLGSGIAVTKDFEDVHGDAAFKIKTIPTVFGLDGGRVFVSLMILLSFAYLAALAFLSIIEFKYIAVLIFLPWAFYTIYKIGDDRNNFKNFFLKNILLAVSVELMIIAVTIV